MSLASSVVMEQKSSKLRHRLRNNIKTYTSHCGFNDYYYLQPFYLKSTGTSGGNGNGAPCVFPFIYRGVSYTECITVAAFGPEAFCSVTSNYDVDGLYGYCNASSATTSSSATVTDTTTTTADGSSSTVDQSGKLHGSDFGEKLLFASFESFGCWHKKNDRS